MVLLFHVMKTVLENLTFPNRNGFEWMVNLCDRAGEAQAAVTGFCHT
jgi:hypothetical protein